MVDIVLTIQTTEIPLGNQQLCDTLWAVAGQGADELVTASGQHGELRTNGHCATRKPAAISTVGLVAVLSTSWHLAFGHTQCRK